MSLYNGLGIIVSKFESGILVKPTRVLGEVYTYQCGGLLIEFYLKFSNCFFSIHLLLISYRSSSSLSQYYLLFYSIVDLYLCESFLLFEIIL